MVHRECEYVSITAPTKMKKYYENGDDDDSADTQHFFF
jgi:hypothetical protein